MGGMLGIGGWESTGFAIAGRLFGRANDASGGGGKSRW